MPRIVGFLNGLRAHEGAGLPQGVAGFCWGGRVVAVLCHDKQRTTDGQTLVNAGFCAHPAGLSVPDDLEQVKLPLSMTVGTQDFALKPDGVRKIQELWRGRQGGKEEITVVEGARHGFAIRGNQASEEEAKQESQAQDQAMAWFGKWLVKKEIL